MNTIMLTDAELALLDGRCTEATQRHVDAAKERIAMAATRPELPAHLAGFVADVVREARSTGRLGYRHESIRGCPVCKARPEPSFVLYKSGPNKGRPNYDKPRYLPAVELAWRFVTGSVAVGACRDCMDRVGPHLREALRDVRAELPEQLTGRPPRFTRHNRRHCTACGWQGHDGQMGRRLSLLGGSWPAACPDCGAVNDVFSSEIVKTLDGFVVVEANRTGNGRDA